MRRIHRLVVLGACLAALVASWPGEVWAQRRPAPAPHHQPVRRGAVVFVGGYFYDPFFGPYPWWPRHAYPYAYYPLYDNRAIVRVIATPKDAAVYVDGFYAGTVHDFNDWFQGLPLTPGGHEIVLFLDGYRTVRERIYLAPESMFRMRHTMERVAPGEVSEPPAVAPSIPPPPSGTFMPPRTPPAAPPRATATERADANAPHGTLSLVVQPANADVAIDGEAWASSDGKTFVVQLPAGPHRIVVAKSGYQQYSGEVQVRDGETTQLSVALAPGKLTHDAPTERRDRRSTR